MLHLFLISLVFFSVSVSTLIPYFRTILENLDVLSHRASSKAVFSKHLSFSKVRFMKVSLSDAQRYSRSKVFVSSRDRKPVLF